MRSKVFLFNGSQLSQRQQYANINNNNSPLKYVKYEVPQGSILGPLLFIIYTNDFVHSSRVLHKIIFANDTNLFAEHNNIHELQDLLNKELLGVDHSFKANRLFLNIGKTNSMEFLSNKKQIKMENFPN